MRLALDAARMNITEANGGPFGACIVRHGEVVSVASNLVLTSDATAHAEINAIREASRVLKNHILSDCVIYSTTEPCPMCFSAIHWAQIPTIIFGTRIEDAAELGFNELFISNYQVKTLGKSSVEIIAGFQSDSCLSLMKEWSISNAHKVY